MANHEVEATSGHVTLISALTEHVFIIVDNPAGFVEPVVTAYMTLDEAIKLRETLNAVINEQHAYQNNHDE